jgi:predicted nucleotide-binding protein
VIAVEKLRAAQVRIRELTYPDWPGLATVRRDLQLVVRKAIGENSHYIKEIDDVAFSPAISTSGTNFSKYFERGKTELAGLVDTIIADIEWSDDVPVVKSANQVSEGAPNSVFLVHGHDEEAKQTVARFLEKGGIKVIILHEQPDGGRTIIEKLEANALVGAAIVLLTPDDEGYSMKAPDKKEPRARQNVVLELGYFSAKLGRSHVIALVKPPVTKPSDYDGVVYTVLDEHGGWKLKIASELREMGLRFDLAKAG